MDDRMSKKAGQTGGRSTGRTILVVEDDPDVRYVTDWMLRKLGYETLQAGDGPAALDLLKRHQAIDLMFSDVVMPKGMSGMQLAAAALQFRPGLKVLLTTGYSDVALDAPDMIEDGIRTITKPYTADDLKQALAAIFED